MIPVQLTIQGLYSYQERQTIDFTKLTAANLFGIFGSVGSGKSSILEAITFALYGKTDRLNLSGDNRNYNMMNLKSNELLIDFVFETGKSQTAYRVTVKGRRNSKKFDDVKALDRTAYQKQNDEWSPIEQQQFEASIGLSYENFKRTIIIPQGQFQEFLQLGNKDRTQMMKELFNLEKFELFYKVASLESKNHAQMQNIEGQLQQLGELDVNQINSFQEQKVILTSEIELKTTQVAELQKAEAQWKLLLEQSKKLAELKRQLETLKADESRFAELETKLNQYEQCHIRFKSLLDALAVSNHKIKQKRSQIESETVQLKKIEADIVVQELNFEAIKKAYDDREQLKQKADELDRIIRIQTLNQQVTVDQERLKKGDLFYNKTQQDHERLKLEKEALEQTIKAEKSQLPDLSVLSKVKAWYVENRNFTQQANEIRESVLKFQKEIEILNHTFQSILIQPAFAAFEPNSDISGAIQFLKEKTESHKRTIAEKDTEADHLRVQSKLETYARELNDGQPCPLCGSLHHPEIFSAASVSESLSKLMKFKQSLEKEIASMTDLTIQLNDLAGKEKFNNAHLLEQQTKVKALQSKIDQHQSLFVWPDYSQEEVVVKAFELSETLLNRLKKQEASLDEAAKQLDKMQKDKDRFQAEIERLKTALIVSQTEVKAISEQLRYWDLKSFEVKNAQEIKAEKQQLLKQLAGIEKQFGELSTLLTELRRTKDMLSGSLKSNQSEWALEQEDSAKLQTQVFLKLKETSYAEIAEVELILAQTIDLESEKAVLAHFKQRLAVVQNQTEQLQLELGDKSYNLDAHQLVESQMQQAKQLLNQRNQELGKISELLKKLQKDIESQAVLRKELDQLELRAENIKVMKSLFKGSGFVNYISSVYLQNLCNTANDRFFQLTRQKLSLEITEDNSFQVRDFMNGGKVRSVKTLSGGQTFQAALSLALALADNIQKITESNQNFFFLDEGFGSLDKESLSVVFDTLKSLRKERRIVGVISHVEEMQQEIDAHLRIENDEERGSLIRTSF